MPGLLRRLFAAVAPPPPATPGKPVRESYDLGDRVFGADRYLTGFGGGPDRLYLPYGGGPTDRKGGGLRPILSTELDLQLMRGASRLLCDANQFAIGFLGRLTDFTVGDGFAWKASLKAAPDPTAPPVTEKDPLVVAVEQVWDDWRQMAEWGCGEEDREAEAFRRWSRDGEVFLRFFAGGPETDGLPHVRFVEPELVTAPAGETQGPWSWGVETDPDDVETRLAIFVKDPSEPPDPKLPGSRWGGEVVPYAGVLMLKGNTDRTIKRGLPDFWPVHDDLEFCRKVLRSSSVVAEFQAKIAYVREHPPGVTETQVNTLLAGEADYTGRDLSRYAAYADRTFPTQATGEGEGLDIASGTSYQPGPAATGIPLWIQLEQACLRGAGSRWGMPEFFSGDSSNNNYASILVSGGPFERATKRRQKAFGGFQRQIALKVLAYAEAAGRLPAGTCRRITVTVVAPGVSIADPAGEEQIRDVRKRNGVLSATTWQEQVGLDPKVEAANTRREQDEQGGGQGGFDPLGGPPGGGDNGDGGGFGESYAGRHVTRRQYRLLSEDDRAGLVKKVITNRAGNRQTVYVNPQGDTTTAYKAGAKLAEVFGAAKQLKDKALDTKVGRVLQAGEHALFTAAHKTRDVAEAVAAARGMHPDKLAVFKRSLAVADFIGGYASGAAGAALGGVVGGKVGMMLPTASAVYLAYSAAADPAATWRAALSVVAESSLDPRHVARSFAAAWLGTAHESADAVPAWAGALADLLAGDDTDWRQAVFLAALGASHDPAAAVRLAAESDPPAGVLAEGTVVGVDKRGHKYKTVDGKHVPLGGGEQPAAKRGAKAAPAVKRSATAAKAPPEPKPSAKAAAAKLAHVMVDAKVQRYSEDHNEPKFAKAVGGASFPNGEPVDVAVPRKASDSVDWQAATDADRARLTAWKAGGGKGKRPETTQLVGKIKHGIELKTMTVGEGGRIFMNSYAQVRKVVWEKESGAAFHTVVIDDRLVYNAKGDGVHDESQRKFYYRRGVAGSATVEGMHPCGSLEEVQSLMGKKESQLPPNAQRTDAHLTAGDWIPFQDEGGKGYKDRKTGDTVRAKK